MKKSLIFHFSFLFLSVAFATGNDTAALAARLVYGAGWSRAGRAVKATMESDEFKALSAGRYSVDFVDEEGETDIKRMASLKMPFVLVMSGGECVGIADALKADDTPAGLIAKFDDACAKAAEKRAMDAALSGDAAWQRHLAMPFTDHDGNGRVCLHADGLEIIEEATWYRQNGRLADGEKFIAAQKAMPDAYLDTLQKQSIVLAEAALYIKEDFTIPDPSKKEAVFGLLKTVVEMDRNSLWGVGANGLLERLGGK